MTYNARLQMTQVAAGSMMTVGLNWGPVNNNGTLQQQTINRQNGVLNTTQTYGYDGVNRLTSAAEAGNWSQSYVYDNVGNRAVTGNSTVLISNYTPQTSLSAPPPPGSSANWPFDPATNHWAQPAAAYDAAGNTTGVRTQAMGYDAESRMTSWSDSSTGSSVSFTYDGDGRRVTKTSSVGTTTYVYDPLGNLAVESGGPAVATATSYLTRDHLGSVRLVTNGSGGGCLGAHDYLPFGEEIPGTLGRGAVPCYPAMDTQSDTAWKFGGQERDAETGFDNFLARHMAGPMGRFLSVDPGNANGSAGDPQSWNGYAYGGNSPLVNIDPSGMFLLNSGNQNSGDNDIYGPDYDPELQYWWSSLRQQTQEGAYDFTNGFIK
jgi:RHS repeat-associated protein